MDEYYIKIALKEAKKAFKNDDVPVGAVIVENNRIISKAYNRKEKDHSVISHAEIIAIKKACKKKKTTYLNDCVMYVTLEPCMMCTGAILQSHIKKIVYCIDSPKYGYMSKEKNINVEKTKDILSDESTYLLKEFFKQKRK